MRRILGQPYWFVLIGCLIAQADLVRGPLPDDSPRAERHTRSDWAMTVGDAPS